VPMETDALIMLPNGGSLYPGSINVRATEYSVGSTGASAMPGLLPPTSAYAYAVELSADEAIAANATSVILGQTVILYVEDYLNLPVGTSLPSGSYDPGKGAWVPSTNGRVIKVLGVSGGLVSLDLDGSGAAASGLALQALGFELNDELRVLASLYPAGQKLLRVPIAHFSSWSVSPDNGPPPGAPDNSCDQVTCTDPNGNDIPCTEGPLTTPCEYPPVTPGAISCNDTNLCASQAGEGPGAWGGNYHSCNGTTCGTLYCCPPYHALDGNGNCSAGGGADSNTCSSPPPPPVPDPNGPGDCSDPNASTIECQRMSLGEDVRIAGTPFSLHYESDRQRGRKPFLNIPLSGPIVATPVTGINLQVSVAGHVYSQNFGAGANQITTFSSWDGTDAYGRLLQGAQPITVSVSDVYSGVYQNSTALGVLGTGTPIAGSTTRQSYTMSQGWTGTVDLWDSLPQGLGGWTLNVQHTYDVTGRKLRYGDGRNQTLNSLPPVIQTIAGTGQATSSGDGGQAVNASVWSPEAVAVGPDGSVYIAESGACVRQIAPNGTITTFAGICNSPGFSGDGGPATAAQLQGPDDIAVGPDGSVFIADTSNVRIRRVDPQGAIHTVAGTGGLGFSGDGGLATSATLGFPMGVDVAPDGTLYIADTYDYCVRSVSPDGVIRTVAGNNSSTLANPSGNEGPATATSLGVPTKVRVGSDGSLYIAESVGNVVRRVGTDGIIRAFAGTGAPGYAGDGGPARAASLSSPQDIALGLDGSVYVVDLNETVRKVAPNGTISTFAGVSRTGSFGGDGGPAAAATMGASSGVRLGPNGSLYIAGTNDNRVRRVQPPLPGFSASTDTLRMPSEDGSQVYIFDGNGRHQQTVDAYTGAVIYQFSYDGAGRLATIADASNNLTQINRDPNGNLSSIVAPFGQQTVLTPDANGYLASATDPASEKIQFTYDANGLMQTRTDARSGFSRYTFDSLGRLTRDQDPAGGAKTLSSTSSTTGFTVASTTSLQRQTTYQTTTVPTGSFGRQNTVAGLPSALQFAPNSVTKVTAPDTTTTTTAALPDPRPGFGMLSPTRSIATTTPSGLTSTQTTTRSAMFSNNSLWSFTEQTNLNGNAWTRVFDAGTSTWTSTSPVGRTTTVTVDSANRPLQVAVPNVAPVQLGYSAHGLLAAITQGSSTWLPGYDTQGYLATRTDPLSHTVTYFNDALGRPYQTELPDGRLLMMQYDGNSNATQITLPSGEPHDFTFTPVDLLASYEPPSVSSASPTTQYVYDLDRELKTVTRPDGVTLTYGYDSAGRLQTTTIPQGTVTLAYNASTGHLQSSTAPSGEAIAYAFDGFLKTGETWSGPVAGSLSLGFDNNFRMTSQTVNGTALTFVYDPDGLLQNAGAITVTRDQNNGLLLGTTLGAVTDSYGYDSNGLFASYTAAFSGTSLYAESVLRDAVGRITQKTETVQGTTHVWGYTFDATGRLTEVTKDSNFFSHYGYDADDNRTTHTNAGGTVNPTYDAQDRLAAYGSATYGYTLDGELTTKTVGGQTTSYTYDPLGNLLHVGPPTGSAIDYVVDGENRRVGKKLAGTLSEGFLYQDGLNVVAQLDGSGNLVARYVFGSKPNVPDYFTTSAGTFRILSDYLGSPRLVVNSSSGAVVEESDYDEFGNVTNDTNPGLTPFGFAGGLYDKDTGLVRFGVRDYDASVGRWTSKDPIRFKGGSFNLYGYVVNDPVNRIDPRGEKDLLICLQTVPFGDVAELAACLFAPDSGDPYRTAPEDCDKVWHDTWDACTGGGGSWSKCLADANQAEADCRKRNNQPSPNMCFPAVPFPEPLPIPFAP
jgi:RHS repeat-associated protein